MLMTDALLRFRAWGSVMIAAMAITSCLVGCGASDPSGDADGQSIDAVESESVDAEATDGAVDGSDDDAADLSASDQGLSGATGVELGGNEAEQPADDGAASEAPTDGDAADTAAGDNSDDGLASETEDSASKAEAAKADAEAGKAGATSTEAAMSTEGMLDAGGNLKLDAIATMSGADLDALLGSAGYVYKNSQIGWVKGENSSFGAVRPVGGEGNGYVGMTQRELSALNSLDSDAVYVLNASGYKTAQAAIEGLCGLNIDDIAYPNAETVVAVASNGEGQQFWVSGVVDGSVTRFIIATDAGVSCGLLSQLVGVNLGKSVADAWKLSTGVDVGDMMALAEE